MNQISLARKIEFCINEYNNNSQNFGCISKSTLEHLFFESYSTDLEADNGLWKCIEALIKEKLHVLFYGSEESVNNSTLPFDLYHLCCEQLASNSHEICKEALKSELNIQEGDITRIVKDNFGGDGGLNYACKYGLFSDLREEIPSFLCKLIIQYCMIFNIQTFEEFRISVKDNIDNKLSWWQVYDYYMAIFGVVYAACEPFGNGRYKIKIGETYRPTEYRITEHLKSGEFTQDTLLNLYQPLIPRKQCEKNLISFIKSLNSSTKVRDEVYIVNESDKELISNFLSDSWYLTRISGW